MFGIADYAAFCAVILLFLALPGPGDFVLVSALGTGGFRADAAAAADVILGDQVLLWLAVAAAAALLAARPAGFKAMQHLGAACPGSIGLRLLLAHGDGGGSPVRILPHHDLRQALWITLPSPKAIVCYAAFLPIFIDPASHREVPAFAAMALTIAVITALLLCALAQATSQGVCAHKRLALSLQRMAGLLLVALGLRLARG